MDLSNLKPAVGATKARKRIGRGQGSGHGGTSTRGHKGQKSRSGYSRKIGFEGGQMPLQRRVPKFGFKNINRVEYAPINIEVIQNLCDKKGINVFNIDILHAEGLVSRGDLVKILGNGKLSTKVTVQAHSFSKSAIESIEAAGGSIEKI